MSRVSVIVPTYNRADCVGRAIDSILAQTVPCAELIVVDDGSTDETPTVLQRYGSKLWVLRQPNLGPGAARHRGLAAATGDWVAFLDSDDLWHPEKIERQLAALRAFPECGACYTDVIFQGGEFSGKTAFTLAGLRRPASAFILSNAPREFLATSSYLLWLQASLVRRDLACRVGFDPALCDDDEDFSFRLALATRHCLVDAPLVTVDRDPGRTRLTQEAEELHPRRLSARQFMYQKWLGLPIPASVRPYAIRRLRNVHRRWATSHLLAGRRPAARRAALRALRLSLLTLPRLGLEPRTLLELLAILWVPALARARLARRNPARTAATAGPAPPFRPRELRSAMSEGTPRVSVVIPTFNRAFCIADAVESCLAQGVPDLEVIVVDDGSTDGTGEVLQPYARRIRYLWQPNAGVSGAESAGLLAATGRWVCFLGSDDELLPGTLSRYLENLEEHPQAVAHVGNAILTGAGPDLDLFSLRGLGLPGDPWEVPRPLVLAVQTNFFLQATLVLKQAALRAGLFDTRLSLHEDGDFLYRLALEGPWLVSATPAARICRKGPPGQALSAQHTRDPEASPASLSYIYAKLLARHDLLPSERRFVRHELAGALRWWARAAHGKDGRVRCDLLLRSFRVSPGPKTLIGLALPLLLRRSAGFAVLDRLARLRRPQAGYRRSEAERVPARPGPG